MRIGVTAIILRARLPARFLTAVGPWGQRGRKLEAIAKGPLAWMPIYALDGQYTRSKFTSTDWERVSAH